VLANFRRNLTIRHLVNCFNTDDASTEIVSLETSLQLALGLTRTKYQNRFCIPNTRNYHIVGKLLFALQFFYPGIHFPSGNIFRPDAEGDGGSNRNRTQEQPKSQDHDLIGNAKIFMSEGNLMF
jgi:hypothetical protein